MVAMKAKKSASRTAKDAKGVVKSAAPAQKIRIGVLVGKDFDPVKKGTQWPEYPQKYVLTNDDWGKYSVDVATALKMQQDSIPTSSRSTSFPAWRSRMGPPEEEPRQPQLLVRRRRGHHERERTSQSARRRRHEVPQEPGECRLDPSWDYYDWVLCKPRYMEQCRKAGIPMIPTVVYTDGFDPKQCLKDPRETCRRRAGTSSSARWATSPSSARGPSTARPPTSSETASRTSRLTRRRTKHPRPSCSSRTR
ncbi:unnamed protein product [Prorocentrum cordatum]|uniref:Uncharacterized protein n=1 Tax=Prorocentrum cordatum TaxID=2364126 RepID=A0ABN9QEF6_9DINO|nr:unnamed protein product [Polarella glacialis]